MLSIPEYISLDAIGLTDGVRHKEFSSAEVMACAVEQARKINPILNAIVHENYDRAIEQAKVFDSSPDLLNQSRVAGLPILIKDLAAVKGLPISSGSRLYEGHIATYDSNIVSKYLHAGLIVLGKSNTPEFGLTLTTESLANGICRNPWNLQYSVGGSSGGAAAAVAAGILPVAHATDGGGSIRIPASCCGLFGLKPSRGLTAIEETLAASWSGMSVGHVVSRSVRDSAAFLDLIKIEKPYLFPLPSSPESFFDALNKKVSRLKIGIQLQHPMDQKIDAECTAGVMVAAQLCESLGHELEEISHPVNYKAASSAMSKIINLHVFQSVSPRLQELGLTLEDSTLEASSRIMAGLGSTTSAIDYVAARDTLKQMEQQTAELHSQYDIIISPVLSKTPPQIGWLNMNSDDMREYTNRFKAYSGFTALYNGTGQPSMSVPLHRSASGLPIGIMFTAAWGEDLRLLQLARQLEQLAAWPRTAKLEFKDTSE